MDRTGKRSNERDALTLENDSLRIGTRLVLADVTLVDLTRAYDGLQI